MLQFRTRSVVQPVLFGIAIALITLGVTAGDPGLIFCGAPLPPETCTGANDCNLACGFCSQTKHIIPANKTTWSIDSTKHRYHKSGQQLCWTEYSCRDTTTLCPGGSGYYWCEPYGTSTPKYTDNWAYVDNPPRLCQQGEG